MERNAVLVKTPKGQTEVRSRTHGLTRELVRRREAGEVVTQA